jgi:uncharacterized membrane protein YbhN (UPF0104 family)
VVNVRWAQVVEAFRGASLPWTVAAIASVPLTLALVTVRWGLLVDSGGRAHRWRVLWDSVVLGQAVNILIPLRFGEGARLAVTSRGLDLPVGQVAVGLALERAFDVAAFGTLVLMMMAAGAMPDAFEGLLPAAATVTMVTMGAVILFIWLGPASLNWLQHRISLPARAAAWIAMQEAAIRNGWTGLMRPAQLVMISLLTALIPLTAAATNLLVLRAFALPVPTIAALVLLVVLQIGTAVVSVPGNVGVFHFLTVVTLAAWDIPRPAAVATAVVLHVVALGPKIVLGAISIRDRSLS